MIPAQESTLDTPIPLLLISAAGGFFCLFAPRRCREANSINQPIHFHGNHRLLFFCLYYTIGTGQLSVMFGFADE